MLYVYRCYYYHQFIGKPPGLENINIEILSLDREEKWVIF